MVSDLLSSITLAIERVAEEKYMLLNKVLMFLICMIFLDGILTCGDFAT
jgi:hypothetical protein